MNNGTAQRMVRPLAFRTMGGFPNATCPPPGAAARHAVEEPPQPKPDTAAALRAAHEQGRLDALAGVDAEVRAQRECDRDVLARMVLQFQQEKQRYFNEVEGEVVKLALAIAERILHREAEMDPTLLAGVARVALGQITDTSEAVLHVSSQDVARWHETLQPPPKGLTVEADDAMLPGEVVLKTRSGSVDLGLRGQLKEIERGFFELLGRKPPVAA